MAQRLIETTPAADSSPPSRPGEAFPLPDRRAYEHIRAAVESWFDEEALTRQIAAPPSPVARQAIAWLAQAGNRWRPLLLVCAYEALSPASASPDPHNIPPRCEEALLPALAAECFHKASLIHDDIEDFERYRYGRPTLPCALGVPEALNVGDWLLGQGYRLAARWPGPDALRADMIARAAESHCRLCVGQGAELAARRQGIGRVEQLLAIFRDKTAPAFNMALAWGALAQGADPVRLARLERFGSALGVAYQIRDDLRDVAAAEADAASLTASLPAALAYETASPDDRALLDRLTGAAVWSPAEQSRVATLVTSATVRTRAAALLGSYRRQAQDALAALAPSRLVGLLAALIQDILRDQP